MQDQGLSGYSAAPLTSSAPLRGECRLSWVGLGHAFRPSGAAAIDTPRLASSRYRLARLRADRTLTVHLCLILLETFFFKLTGNWFLISNTNQSQLFDSWSTTSSQLRSYHGQIQVIKPQVNWLTIRPLRGVIVDLLLMVNAQSTATLISGD